MENSAEPSFCKCKIFSVHHKRYSNMGVVPNYIMNNILLDVKQIKNVGVFYDSLLVFDKHICEKKLIKLT